nr:DUF2975 domain-containing protein [Lachnoclostridium phocaeense]
MNLTKRRESQGNIVKTRCSEIGMACRILFWISVLVLVAAAVWGIYMGTRSSDAFWIILTDVEGEFHGIVASGQGQSAVFARGVLRESAREQPKLCFMIAVAEMLMNMLIGVCILGMLRIIFQNIEKTETPFLPENARVVRRIGLLLILYSFIHKCVIPFVCLALGVGGGNINVVDIKGLLLGGLVVSLSYIFEYGSVLQKEADETL